MYVFMSITITLCFLHTLCGVFFLMNKTKDNLERVYYAEQLSHPSHMQLCPSFLSHSHKNIPSETSVVHEHTFVMKLSSNKHLWLVTLCVGCINTYQNLSVYMNTLRDTQCSCTQTY